MAGTGQRWSSGKVLLVSGGAGALARQVAQAFGDAGARVVLVDRPGERLQERAAALGLASVGADLRSDEAARDVVARVAADHGPVDGLIHCAGAFAWAPVADTTDDALELMLGANLRSLVALTRAALPGMVERDSGFVAGVGSMQAVQGGAPGVAAYAAAKAGVVAWLSSLAQELGGTGVRVCTLLPMGVIDTARNRADMPDADPGGWIDPAALADALRFAADAVGRGRIRQLQVWPRG